MAQNFLSQLAHFFISEVAQFFIDKGKNIAPRRNSAAHGGNIITYTEVCADKTSVFSDHTEEYSGLILELLEILYS